MRKFFGGPANYDAVCRVGGGRGGFGILLALRVAVSAHRPVNVNTKWSIKDDDGYWFSVLADTSGDMDDIWFWTTGDSGDASAIQLDVAGNGPWFPDTLGPFYFILDDAPLSGVTGVVPEPASILLWSLGVGLVGLGFCRRNRKAAD